MHNWKMNAAVAAVPMSALGSHLVQAPKCVPTYDETGRDSVGRDAALPPSQRDFPAQLGPGLHGGERESGEALMNLGSDRPDAIPLSIRSGGHNL